MKEKVTKRKQNRIELEKMDDDQLILVEEATDFLIIYHGNSKNDIKKKLTFQFSNGGIESDVNLRIVNEDPINIDLMVVIEAKEGIKDVSSVLDMRSLILHEKASMTFVPSLEIDEMNVSVDHRSTIGTPSRIWLNYMSSRGLSEQDSIELLKRSFLQL